MLAFGIAFVVIVCGLAQLLVNPPPVTWPARNRPTAGAAAKTAAAVNVSPGQILRSPLFYLL